MSIFNTESLMFSIPEEAWELLYNFQQQHPKEWREICRELDRSIRQDKTGERLGIAFNKKMDKEIMDLLMSKEV